MKRIIEIVACFILVIGCSSEDRNLLEEIAVKGGYIQYEETPTLRFNILKLDTEKISESIIDPNENAAEYSLALMYEDTVVQDFVILNSFPSKLDIPISAILSALDLADEDVALTTIFTLIATVKTSTGTYSGLSPDYNEANENQGGNTTDRLKLTDLNNAVMFSVTFYTPPGKKIRGTSFEEVEVGADDAVYNRNGSADETLDLINGEFPPFIDFIAVGSSINDEIGFNSEYIAVTDISTSSLGFVEERIGVTATKEDFDTYPDGSQGFHSEDTDGMIKITFDEVMVPEGQTKSGVSFQAYFGTTTWESLDGLHAYANVTKSSGVEVIEIVSIYGSNVDIISGDWLTFSTGYLNDVLSYQLVIEASNGATPEFIYIDNIIIYEPEEE